MKTNFSENDREHIKRHELTEQIILRQRELFLRTRRYLKLDRPCAIDDGIITLDETEYEELNNRWSAASQSGRLIKFVPASGAATRMFKSILKAIKSEPELNQAAIERGLAGSDDNYQEVALFFERFMDFAFAKELKTVLAAEGFDINSLHKEGHYHVLVDYLLNEKGLGYANKPKGLLSFHYDHENDSPRTPLEEHLIESIHYVRDGEDRCRIHFTVSNEHLDVVRQFLDSVRSTYETRYGVRFDFEFSIQSPSTDTVAVHRDNELCRDDDGRLIFRPGGHGALLKNLHELEADVILIKNIDNVVPDRLKSETIKWKKLLCGYLLMLQDTLFQYQEILSKQQDDKTVQQVINFFTGKLGYTFHYYLNEYDAKQRYDLACSLVFRPIRVCGMVQNVAAPGGGPFWVSDNRGITTPQIVETAQIDMSDPSQRDIFEQSTHFNPVDIVCGVRNYAGEPYDLHRHSDPETYFITEKTINGVEIKALEHPGLWNGGMADWTTVFIEVPQITFNPVKTINNLLDSNHLA